MDDKMKLGPLQQASLRPGDRYATTEEVVEIGKRILKERPELFKRLKAAEELEADAARYRWLRDTLMGAVGGMLVVNEDRLYYQAVEVPVRLQWYPDTPVGFHLAEGATVDEVIDKAMRGEGD